MDNPIRMTLLECASEFVSSGVLCKVQESSAQSEINRAESDQDYRRNILNMIFPVSLDVTVEAVGDLWLFSYGVIHASNQTDDIPFGYLFSILFAQILNTSDESRQIALLGVLTLPENTRFWEQIQALSDNIDLGNVPHYILANWFLTFKPREGVDMAAGNAYRMAFRHTLKHLFCLKRNWTNA